MKKKKKQQKRHQRPASAQHADAGAGAAADASARSGAKAAPPAAAGKLKSPRETAGNSVAGSMVQQHRPSGEGPSDGKAAGPLPVQRLGPSISAAERRRFMSGKISDIRSDGRQGAEDDGVRHRRRGPTDPEEDAEFKKTLKQVLDFVTPQLDKNAQKQYEEAKILALGGTLEKRRKINYAALQRSARRAEAARQEKVKEDKQLGITSHVSQHRAVWEVDKLRKKRKQEFREKKRRREDGLLRLGMDAREKKGLVTIPQHAVRSFMKKSGKT